MTWLTWRQHRGAALVLGLGVAVLGIVAFLLGRGMHDLFPLGIERCAVPPVDLACRNGISRLQQDYDYATPILTLLNLVPFAIGAFLGAPLLAREVEDGTWQLAWTQAVPRMRWLAVKLAALGALTVALAAAFSAFVTWYREPLNLFGRFQINGFDVSGIVPAAYALFAFALATLGGALLRRSLAALAAAFVVFVTMRLAVAVWLRPNYLARLALDQPVLAGSGSVSSPLVDIRDWTLDEGLADAAGNHLGGFAPTMMDMKARDAGLDPATYLHDEGIHRWVSYHPADRFWTFQLIETGIFVGLAAILLILVAQRVKRRTF